MQVVVITGLAQGMGREVALRLAAAGDAVAGFDVDAAGIESLRAELKATRQRRVADDARRLRSAGNPRLPRRGAAQVRARRHRALERRHRLLRSVRGDRPREGEPLRGDQRDGDRGDPAGLPAEHARAPRGEAHRRLVAGGADPVPVRVDLLGDQVRRRRAGALAALRGGALRHPGGAHSSRRKSRRGSRRRSTPCRPKARRTASASGASSLATRRSSRRAIDPATAAEQILRVVRAPKPKLHNPIDTQSRLFLALNRFLPQRVRDQILLRQMDIR